MQELPCFCWEAQMANNISRPNFTGNCCAESLSRVWLSVTPWTVAHQAPLSVGFSRQEHWSGLPRPPPGDLPDSGIEPASLVSTELAGALCTAETRSKPVIWHVDKRQTALVQAPFCYILLTWKKKKMLLQSSSLISSSFAPWTESTNKIIIPYYLDGSHRDF